MKELQVTLADEAATVALGAKMASALADGGNVYLQGTLGAGKTTFCRGFLQSLGHSGAVKSPTYTLVEPYTLDGRRFFHFDLYRLGDPEELEFMGIRDYFKAGNVCLIEWPERGSGFLPEADLTVKVSPLTIGETIGRAATISAQSPVGQLVVERLSALTDA